MELKSKLVDGPSKLFALLDEWGIQYQNYNHKPIFTVEEGHYLVEKIPGAHSKNLFLKNKKGQYYLVVMLGQDTLDLKTLRKQLGSNKLSFASPERLMEKLGLTPGSVTPFGLVHPNGKEITVLLDADMMKHDQLNFHPLQNDRTTTIGREDFLKFIEKTGHEANVVDLPKK